MNDFTNGEFKENMARVSNLISASTRLDSSDTGDAELASDVLRAAVVFLHSSLEEIIRNLYLLRLPNVSSEKLSKVPFASHMPSHRPKNIQLGDLLEYRGQFVENVIHEAINKYVDTLNINNTTQLVECLALADIPHESMKHLFAPLDLLMKRRHQIVHQMDRSNELDPLESPVNSIDVNTVKEWKLAIEAFAVSLFSYVDPATSSVQPTI